MSEAAARTERVRRANLARVLRLVHLDGPQSRAALTEATGLNRSTIAALVGELVDEGLVQERAPDSVGRVGRPSPVVAVDPRVVAIAVNPEVDAITIAAVGLDRRVLARDRIETAEVLTPSAVAASVAARIEQWRAGVLRSARIEGVGLAVPGLVRTLDGIVRIAPHLGWQNAPVRDLVTAATGLRTTVGNDASLGALAEHLFGAARGVDDVVYLNGGASGIGGGVIVHGRPLGGAGGYAGEFGQNRPGIAADVDRRAGDGVLEDEVSRTRLLAAVGLDSADEPTLAAAIAASASATVTDEVARQRRILVTALANAVNVLNPSVVVLGGFLATIAADAIPELLVEVRRQTMPTLADDLELRLAVLAEDRLLIGAAELAFADLLSTPALP
ncbi:ROK family protein [Microbacterium sp. P04]|uniref:ROK family transcriptional regulator n=1 Tax=Microbacterium sp. P04 TaxID=3366947 RepID=UPI0037463BDF